ncbi:MAG: ATP-grasp domain-containing protein [Alphaproteobacteria bacterium]|nr:ATP-grasp domain-containing protein [Alphaproteobacteria bacterium]MBV9554847.1 ATP-grasp domain-containing protein [Alphaproteobacteria bacterium]
MNALLIAFAVTLPYHVLRAATAAGLQAHVLGSGASRGLSRSRHCRGYHVSRCGGDPEIMLAEIRDVVARHGIEVVLPADDVATRLLALLNGRLPVRSTPLPDVATFDLLNDKWNFTRFCRKHGVRVPEARLFDSRAELIAALEWGEIALPLTVKPTNRSGGIGVLHLRQPADLALLDGLDYRPVLTQRHIVGESVSITLLCERGRVRAHVAQQRDARRFRVLTHADLLRSAAQVAELTGYHGTVNYDAILAEADGLAYLVECNPRFWYSIYLVMLAGLNFVDLALHPGTGVATLDRGEMRLSWRDVMARPWAATRLDWRFQRYNFSDPRAYLLLRRGCYDDSDVAVPAAAMAPYALPEVPALAGEAQ